MLVVFSIKQNLKGIIHDHLKSGLLSVTHSVPGGCWEGGFQSLGHRYCLRVAPSVMDTFSAVERVKQQLMMYKTRVVWPLKAMVKWH